MNILFVIPGDINLPTGGYRYDRKIIEAWRKSGHQVTILSLPGNYPFPSEKETQIALDMICDISGHNTAIVDGLAGGAHPQFVQKLSKDMPVIALIHHPLCLESGLDEADAGKLKDAEADGLSYISAVVTTSPTTARSVEALFNLAPEKIHCVLPAVERGKLVAPKGQETVNLLCVGSVIERKGHKFLMKALSELKHLDWHLDCIGKVDFQPPLFDEIKELIKKENLSAKITFHGSVEDNQLEASYSNAHVFVLPSLYEGYGMVYAEAITRGLPVIGTTAGAIPDTVPDGCGLLVEPENVEQLRDALEVLITKRKTREKYRLATIKAADTFPTWESSADKFTSILETVI